VTKNWNTSFAFKHGKFFCRNYIAMQYHRRRARPQSQKREFIGEALEGTSEFAFVDSLNWFLDGMPLSNETSWSIAMDEAGQYDITLVAQNSLCTTEKSVLVEVDNLPTAQITQDGADLTTNEGDAWQWN
jgi:hypothetical protein